MQLNKWHPYTKTELWNWCSVSPLRFAMHMYPCTKHAKAYRIGAKQHRYRTLVY